MSCGRIPTVSGVKAASRLARPAKALTLVLKNCLVHFNDIFII